MPADTTHPSVAQRQPQDPNMKIWRYLSLPKLLSLLQTESLHFARADKLDDLYEGTRPIGNLLTTLAVARRIARESEQPPNEQVYETITTLHRLTLVDQVYVGCWHGGKSESVAMWRQYGSHEGAVAVQSTYGRLVSALPGKTDEGDALYVGMVAYADYHDTGTLIPESEPNLLNPLIFKRIEFAYENEVRAFIWMSKPSPTEQRPNGIRVRVDLAELIESIVVEPTASAWTKTAIEELVRKYGLNVSVRTSAIAMKPLVAPLSLADLAAMQTATRPTEDSVGDHLVAEAFECSRCHITPESVRTEARTELRCPECDRRKDEVTAFNEASRYQLAVRDGSDLVSGETSGDQSVEDPPIQGESEIPSFLLKAL